MHLICKLLSQQRQSKSKPKNTLTKPKPKPKEPKPKKQRKLTLDFVFFCFFLVLFFFGFGLGVPDESMFLVFFGFGVFGFVFWGFGLGVSNGSTVTWEIFSKKHFALPAFGIHYFPKKMAFPKIFPAIFEDRTLQKGSSLLSLKTGLFQREVASKEESSI